MSFTQIGAKAALVILFFATAVPAEGAIVSIPSPFAGTLSESFETFADYGITGVVNQSPYSIMGGAATVTSNFLLTWEKMPSSFPWTLGSNGLAVPVDGTQGMGNNSASSLVTITFTQPVGDFGAYWGESSDGPETSTNVTFYDSSNNIIGTDSFSYTRPGDGVLEWHGYASTTPGVGIAKLTFVGDFPVLDAIQANLVAPVPAPEPSSLLLVCGAIGFASWGRKKRG